DVHTAIVLDASARTAQCHHAAVQQSQLSHPAGRTRALRGDRARPQSKVTHRAFEPGHRLDAASTLDEDPGGSGGGRGGTMQGTGARAGNAWPKHHRADAVTSRTAKAEVCILARCLGALGSEG